MCVNVINHNGLLTDEQQRPTDLRIYTITGCHTNPVQSNVQ